MKFHIHTYGCQMNVRDSEAVEALLVAAGHEKAVGEEDAELVVVNSCTVRQKAEEKAVGKAGNLIAAKKTVGLMGCAVKRMGADVFKRLPKLDFAVGPRAFGLIPRIVAEVGALARRGVKEVCLLGQSVLRYGVRNAVWDESDAPSPGGYTEPFPRLLEAVASVPGIERIRFTSAHPKGCTDELIRVYRTFPQVCRHLHLPVQSGSDRILAEMGRRYTRAEYLAAVKKLRDFDPAFALTTDVIVGYPGETEADFEATRTLMEEAGFDNAFVFKYSPRPGTRSAALPDDVPTAEKERRDQVLLADQEVRGQRNNARLVGTVRDVMVEGPSKRNRRRWSGRDSGNRIVVWDMCPENAGLSLGSCVKVRITEAHPQILIGELA